MTEVSSTLETSVQANSIYKQIKPHKYQSPIRISSQLQLPVPIQDHNNSETHVTASAVFIGHSHRKPVVFMNGPSSNEPGIRKNDILWCLQPFP